MPVMNARTSVWLNAARPTAATAWLPSVPTMARSMSDIISVEPRAMPTGIARAEIVLVLSQLIIESSFVGLVDEGEVARVFDADAFDDGVVVCRDVGRAELVRKERAPAVVGGEVCTPFGGAVQRDVDRARQRLRLVRAIAQDIGAIDAMEERELLVVDLHVDGLARLGEQCVLVAGEEALRNRGSDRVEEDQRRDLFAALEEHAH